jgi:hypothetical protein
MCAGWVGGRRRRRRSVRWWRRRRSLRAAGRTCFHPFRRRATGARGCGRAFRCRYLPPRQRQCLAGSLRGGHLRGGGASVQRRTRWHKESSRCGGQILGVARVCRVGRRRDGGCGGGGRGDGVGRGRWGAGEHVHRRNCAGGHAEARIWWQGGEARGRSFSASFFAVASTDAARWSQSPKFSAQDRANRPAPKKICSACWRNVFAIRRCISAVYIARVCWRCSKYPGLGLLGI